MQSRNWPTNFYAYALVFLCVMMTGANVYLLRVNKVLRNAPAGTIHSASLLAGKEIKTTSGLGLDGTKIDISTAGSDATVLMVYSPTCPYCERNWPNWSLLANTTPHKSTKFVAIDLSGNARPEFINKKDIPRAYIVHRMDPQEVVDLNLILTPETILIGADQKVKKAWYGVLSPENLAELNKLLS